MQGKRNLADYARSGKGRINERYVLTFQELQEIKGLFDTSGLFKAISTAFYVGVEAGYRSARKNGTAGRN